MTVHLIISLVIRKGAYVKGKRRCGGRDGNELQMRNEWRAGMAEGRTGRSSGDFVGGGESDITMNGIWCNHRLSLKFSTGPREKQACKERPGKHTVGSQPQGPLAARVCALRGQLVVRRWSTTGLYTCRAGDWSAPLENRSRILS